MNLYEDQFSEAHDFPRIATPSKFLIIASTPRCGSHMLGHALHQTGSFGFPLEYTQPANFAEWKRRLVGCGDVLTEIQRRRTSPNGVFGIKIHYSHIFEYGGFSEVMRRFPDAHYVLLSRKDVLKQAVSLAIAQQTGVWIAGQKPVSAEPEYDFERINENLRRILLENSGWRYLLSAHGCRHIDLEFDEVRRDLAGTIQRIASLLGIAVDPKRLPDTQVTAKQSGGRNKQWAERFVLDFGRNEQTLLKERVQPLRRLKRVLKRA